MDWRQKVIEEKYSGDVKSFKADFADAVLEGRMHTVSWDNLFADATIYYRILKKQVMI